MVNIHVVGEPRSGKGLIMTWLGLQQADQGVPTDCNYHLNSPNARTIDFVELLNFLKLPRQEPQHLLILDELPGWCDSYVTSSKANRYASHFCNQAAKLGYDIIFSSQRTKRGDINFRENTTYRLKAKMQRLCDTPKCNGAECDNFCLCHVRYDFLDLDNDDEDIPVGKPMKIPFSEFSTIWGRYDTFEPVAPIGLDETLELMQKSDPEKRNKNVNRQVAVLMECWQPTYTLDSRTVKDILLEQGEFLHDAEIVFSRFRRTYRQQAQKLSLQTEKPPKTEQSYREVYMSEWHKLQALTER